MDIIVLVLNTHILRTNTNKDESLAKKCPAPDENIQIQVKVYFQLSLIVYVFLKKAFIHNF